MKSIPSDSMESAVIDARLKAAKISAMAWADAQVYRETLDTMQKHGIRPMLAAMQQCAERLAAMQQCAERLENIQYALGSLKALETAAPRLDAALNALDNLINDRIDIMTKKNKETPND